MAKRLEKMEYIRSTNGYKLTKAIRDDRSSVVDYKYHVNALCNVGKELLTYLYEATKDEIQLVVVPCLLHSWLTITLCTVLSLFQSRQSVRSNLLKCP